MHTIDSRFGTIHLLNIHYDKRRSSTEYSLEFSRAAAFWHLSKLVGKNKLNYFSVGQTIPSKLT